MLRLGEWYAPWGKLAQIGCLDGERYYWFIDAFGTVSMIPASIAEPMHSSE